MCKQEPFSYQNPPKYRFVSMTFLESGTTRTVLTRRNWGGGREKENIFESKILWNWFALEVTKGRCDITKSKYGQNVCPWLTCRKVMLESDWPSESLTKFTRKIVK